MPSGRFAVAEGLDELLVDEVVEIVDEVLDVKGVLDVELEDVVLEVEGVLDVELEDVVLEVEGVLDVELEDVVLEVEGVLDVELEDVVLEVEGVLDTELEDVVEVEESVLEVEVEVVLEAELDDEVVEVVLDVDVEDPVEEEVEEVVVCTSTLVDEVPVTSLAPWIFGAEPAEANVVELEPGQDTEDGLFPDGEVVVEPPEVVDEDVVVVDDDDGPAGAEPFKTYTVKKLPAPQNSVSSPAQVIEQLDFAARTLLPTIELPQ
ncbi:MAG: hypothetical protein M1820_010390 [Bogoriella megaspora]|nr:MAG: hypothetical protein M1820_010390 [Bogoriella megaspora]